MINLEHDVHVAIYAFKFPAKSLCADGAKGAGVACEQLNWTEMGALLAALRGRRDTRSAEGEQQQPRPSRVTDQDKAVLVSRSQ